MIIRTKTKGVVSDQTLSDNNVMQVYTYSYDYKSKNKGAVNDLNEVMVGAISASWGKLFHIDTELGTKDDLKALVRACGI